MPLRDYLCLECGHQFEELLNSYDHVDVNCPHCETTRVERLPPITGGYKMNSGPSSVRPKGAGSRPRKVK